MPTNTKSLREQRANIWSQMTEIHDRAIAEDRDFTEEERQAYERAEGELDDLGARIEREENHARRQAEFERVERDGLEGIGRESEDLQEQREQAGPTGTESYERAFRSWLRGGIKSLSNDEQRTLQVGWNEVEGRAAGVGTNSAGGYTVPPAFRNRIVERLRLITAVRDVATVITTDTGASLPWPTVDDTTNIGAILAENTQVSEQDVVFGQASIGAYMYTSKLIRVSFQLLNDAAFDVEGFLARILATRIGRIQNQHFTTGTGTGQPLGLVTGGAVGVTAPTGNTTGLTATGGLDALFDLIESLDPAYASGNLQWMLPQAGRGILRKLRDGQNRPLWEPSLQVGLPDSFLGYGIKLNNDMPALAANSKSIAFGDFEEGYLVRDVNDFFLLQLNERYADYLQTGFVGFQRSDGTVQNTNSYKLLQQSAT